SPGWPRFRRRSSRRPRPRSKKDSGKRRYSSARAGRFRLSRRCTIRSRCPACSSDSGCRMRMRTRRMNTSTWKITTAVSRPSPISMKSWGSKKNDAAHFEGQGKGRRACGAAEKKTERFFASLRMTTGRTYTNEGRMNWKEIEQRIGAAVKMARRPVAVAFLDAAPAGVPKFEGTEPSGCSFWRLAAEGRTFYTAPESHFNCAVGAYTHNIPLSPERASETEQTLKL